MRLRVGVDADDGARRARQHLAAVALAAGHVDDALAGRARRDPLVDDEVPAVPVVLLRHVGQRALAGERQRRHALGLVRLNVCGLHGERQRRLPRPMEAPSTAEDIRDVNEKYHDVAAETYDSKWGIDFGEIGQQQVLMKLRKVLGKRLDAGFERALEIGSGTGYFSLNLLQAGAIRAATCTDISPGMIETLRGNAERLRLDVETVVTGAEELPFADGSFDLVLGHAVLHHLPDLEQAFAEFERVLRPGGTVVFAGEPSRYGDRLAQLPKRGAGAVAPAWRWLLSAPRRRPRQRPRRYARPPRGPRAGAVRRHPRLLAGRSRRRRARRRLRAGQRPRRGADGQLVRLDQPHLGGDRRAPGRSVGLATVRLPRLPRLPEARRGAAGRPAASGDLLQPADLRAQAGLSVRGRRRRCRRPPRPAPQRRPAVT